MKKQNPFKNTIALTFPDVKACLVRSSFFSEKAKKAVLNITALGYFEAFINGTVLTENRLMPPKSDYCERDLTKALYPIHDTMYHRIYYYSYDITSLLRCGENVISTHIGAGWFGQDECDIEGMGKWGNNLLVFSLDLTLADGTKKRITPSDTKNKWHESYITKTNIYYGETVDGTRYQTKWKELDFSDDAWLESPGETVPDSEFMLAECPPDKVTGTTVPILIYESNGTKVYDLGSTLAGTPIIEFRSDARIGEKVSVYFADRLNDDMTPDFHYTGGDKRIQHDEFIFSPDFPEKYRLHFTWNAGRYIILSGKACVKAFEEVRSDIRQRIFFKCENEVLQWFFDAYVRTQEVNIHGNIPSDCPHRERLGYTGDGQLCSGAAMYIFDSKEMYRKWMNDIRDCQDPKTGHVQHTAPFYGGGGGPGGWGGAAVIVPWNFYRFFGDKNELKKSFPSMLSYLRYMKAHSDDYLVTREEEKGWCLGDWCPPHNDVKIPESFVNTFFFAECAGLALKSAKVIGNNENTKELTEMMNGAKRAVIEHFFDEKTGSFCEGIQGADAFAVHLGIGGERTVKNLIKKYAELREFDTGIFGTYYLIKVLFDLGENELALSLLTNKSENSFYNMMKHGSRNLWENWDGCDSLCHPMFGASAEFIASKLLGLDVGFFEMPPEKRRVCPVYLPGTGNISALIVTEHGDTELNITYDKDGKQTVTLSQEEEK